MLLRRFTKHVTDQNWFAVGLDVIVVVVGIFLGMQVTDWNEVRKENILHQLYIDRLSRDINIDLSSAKARGNYFKKVKAYGEKALSYLDQPPEIRQPTSETLVAFLLASSKWDNNYTQITYDELKSTGRIHLIGSFKVSDLVSSYYEATSLRKNDAIIDKDYFKLIRSIIRADLQNVVFDSCEVVDSVIRSSLKLNESCRVEVDANLVNILMKEIENHPNLKTELIFKISQLRYNISLFEEQVLASESVLNALLVKNK
jgi:hypothetical protein